ncbi:MAG TPA: hypothetical protein VKX16_16955 [Chloroflexota bacterium]|nr:hypothetical protein [Chloroflexota bacterium]
MRVLRWLPLGMVALGTALVLPAVARSQGSLLLRTDRAIQQSRVVAGRHARKRSPPSPVVIQVSTGYNESYRDAAWVPVRVSVYNRTPTTITATVEVPDPSAGGNTGPPLSYRVLYQMPVVLPGDETKQVTLYMPSSSVSSGVTVQLRAGGRILASALDSPTSFGQAVLSIGALSNDPANITWLRQVDASSTNGASVVRLRPETLDPLPAALSNFDVIVLRDDSVGQLDRDQLQAIDRYVHNGGGLVLVGGPGWQGSLHALPSDLIPGSLTGTTTLPDLSGLLSLQPGKPRRAATSVSVLRDPRGSVLASQQGVPLVVQESLGQGQIIYLAFDPSLDPVARWSGESSLLTQLFDRAAPAAETRADLPQSSPAPSIWVNPYGPNMNIASELSNVPAAALPSILLFLILTVAYIVLLGPANFMALRRLHRPELLWITIPAGALLCLGATFAIAFQLKGSTVLVNSVGMVTLDGTGGPHQASLYMGLFAPVSGDYNLTYDGPALPEYVPQFNSYGGPTQSNSNPLGLRLQEGSQTTIQFLGMSMWSMRDAAIHTTVDVPGTVRSALHLDRRGYIVGAVHNDTPLTLIHPAIVAGRSVIRLADMPPEKTVPVKIKPAVNVFDGNNQPIWYQMYGQPQYGGPVIISGRGPCFGCNQTFVSPALGGPCCFNYGSSPQAPTEHNLTDRIRNSVTQLPDAQNLTSLGEVYFVAWNQQPLGRISVDGVTPQRRDLNLVVAPLSIDLNRGPFVLRNGTFGAHLINVAPQPGTNGGCCCCGWQGGNPIDVAAGGSATFEFDLPRPGHLHFRHLWLSVNAGGADGTGMGRLWDWHAGRWVTVDLALGYAPLKNPDRFISSQGSLLVKLVPGDLSQDIRISNVPLSLQLSGDGDVT